jgi:hypothetical protein
MKLDAHETQTETVTLFFSQMNQTKEAYDQAAHYSTRHAPQSR